MAESEALAVARRYHGAWTGKDFEAAGRRLSESLKTDTPVKTYKGKDDFLEAVRGFGQIVTRVEMLAEFGDEEQALLLYDLDLVQIGKLRIAEHFIVRNGFITLIRHVHDTAPFRAPGG